jgi:hypothetical protein
LGKLETELKKPPYKPIDVVEKTTRYRKKKHKRKNL